MKRHRYRLLTAGLISGLLVAGMAEVPVQAAAPDPGSPSANEFQQVFALPSGGFQLESAVVPQRVKQADGSWADIDLNLGKDGTGWRPRMSPVDVAFSPGGDAPLGERIQVGQEVHPVVAGLASGSDGVG